MKRRLRGKILTAGLLMAMAFSFQSLAKDVADISSCTINGNEVVVSGTAREEEDPAPETTAAAAAVEQTTEARPQDDGKYYLFELKPYEDSIGDRADFVFSMNKGNSFSFKVPFQASEDNSRLFNKYVMAVKLDGKFQEISNQAYITNPEVLAAYTEAFPDPLTKKGLLVENDMTADAFDLGVKHVIFNIPFHHILTPEGGLTHNYNGKTYHFNKTLIESYDNMVSQMSNRGVVVTAILLNGWNPSTPELIHPNASQSSKAFYYMLNTSTKDGFETTRAIISFLAERYNGTSRSQGRISNWIVGNEINNNEQWNYAGPMDVDRYAREYSRSFRVIYNAIKSTSKNARIYFSTDYTWNQKSTNVVYGAKTVIDAFNNVVRREGQIDWGLAYHPYPIVLTEPEFWLDDGTGRITDSYDTQILNFKNLHVLTDYFQQDYMRNASGGVRHIILSEQGFTSKSATRGDVLQEQAAAYAYAYYLVESNPYIDSFILSRQVDSIAEVNQYCAFGLWTVDMNSPEKVKSVSRKKIWEVFDQIDGKNSLEVTAFAKPIIGIEKWSDVVPNFKRNEN